MTLLRNAVAALPQLVEQLETGRQSSAPVDAHHGAGVRLRRRPRSRAAGRGAGAGGSHRRRGIRGHRTRSSQDRGSSAAEPAAAKRRPRAPRLRPPLAEPSAAVMDPQLHEIFSKETSSHLAEIRDYLRKRAGQPAPHDLPESVYRAIHTLSGSSKMAEARHGIRITEPLNHFMRKVFDSGRGLSDTGLATLADAVRAIDNVVSHINETTAFFSEQPSLARAPARARDRTRSRARRRACQRYERLGDRARFGTPRLRPPLPRRRRPLCPRAPPAESARGRGGVRSRDRQYLQRRGHRADRGGRDSR